MERNYLEDYVIGETLVSPGKTITEADMVSFTAWSGDWYSLQTDLKSAQGTQFGGKLAFALVTFALSSVLPLRLGPNVYLPKGFIAFLGMENIRFISPLKIGDTAHTELTVTGLEPKDKKGLLIYDAKVKNQLDKVLMSVKLTILVARKPNN